MKSNRINPAAAAVVVAFLVFVWNALVTAGAWFVENNMQTWGGFAILAVGVVILGPITAAVAAYNARPNNGCAWGIGVFIAVFVWNALVTVGAWALENYVQTWAGFILLAVGVVILGPITAAVAAYYIANRVQKEPEAPARRSTRRVDEPAS